MDRYIQAYTFIALRGLMTNLTVLDCHQWALLSFQSVQHSIITPSGRHYHELCTHFSRHPDSGANPKKNVLHAVRTSQPGILRAFLASFSRLCQSGNQNLIQSPEIPNVFAFSLSLSLSLSIWKKKKKNLLSRSSELRHQSVSDLFSLPPDPN